MRMFNRPMILIGSFLSLLFAPPSAAQNWSKILRDATKVSDRVLLDQADEFVQEMAASKSLRESISRKIDDWDSLDAVGKRRRVSWQLDSLAMNLDSASAKAVTALEDTAKPTAIILIEGSQKTNQLIPDIASRAKFIEAGGIETVAAIGIHGDEAARQALKLDLLIDSGKLITPPGTRAATLKDFGSFLSTGGDKAWGFWKSMVVPHWDKWLAGGAITAFLVNPDLFINAAGDLTEEGLRKLTELAGETLAAAIRGVGEGSKSAGESLGRAFGETYFSGWNGICALLGTTLLMALTIPRSRIWIFRLFRKHLGPQTGAAESPDHFEAAKQDEKK